MLRKATKLHVHVLAFLSKPERSYWNMILQHEAVIIEVHCMYCASTTYTIECSSTGIAQGQTFAINKLDLQWHKIYSVKTTYLSVKVLTFAKNENIQFFKTTANLSYNPKCWHFSDHTNLFRLNKLELY